jgi:hypothetical protein
MAMLAHLNPETIIFGHLFPVENCHLSN